MVWFPAFLPKNLLTNTEDILIVECCCNNDGITLHPQDKEKERGESSVLESERDMCMTP